MRAERAALRVPWGQRIFGALFAHCAGLGKSLGDLETRVLATVIAGTRIDRPVYICGLARSGSTVLLEALNAHRAFTAHRYSDYPPIWTPFWWNALRARLPLPKVGARERAHGDRIAVTPDSPEAFEEVLWMYFFATAHDPDVDQVLDADVCNPRFEAFHAAHVRKLLAVRGATRYVAKGNYNIARLGYLRRLYPDARFVIPLRDPFGHVTSLVRQDRLFCEAARSAPAVERHLARIGHFEFGPRKRAQNLGDRERVREIAARHAHGDAFGAYALQWAAVYGSLLDRLEADSGLAAACHFVRFENLCREPLATLHAMFTHAEADDADGQRIVAEYAARMHAPDYYEVGITDSDRATIATITAPVVARLERFTPR